MAEPTTQVTPPVAASGGNFEPGTNNYEHAHKQQRRSSRAAAPTGTTTPVTTPPTTATAPSSASSGTTADSHDHPGNAGRADDCANPGSDYD